VTKVCSCCKKEKKRSEFGRVSGASDGKASICLECSAERTRRWNYEVELGPSRIVDSLCTKCNQIKPVSNFRKNSSRKTGVHQLCKVCEKTQQDAKFARRRLAAEIPITKCCKKCNQVKPSSEFTKDCNSRDGLLYQCKVCFSQQNQRRARLRVDKVTIPSEKKCHTCGKIKSSAEFNRTKHKVDGLQDDCKECAKIKRDARISEMQDAIVIPETKKCYQCNTTKASSEFCKNKTRSDGLHYVCKECQIKAAHVRIKRVRANQVIPDSKVCYTCKSEKSASEFNKDSRSPDGLQYNCRGCEIVRNRAYRESLGEEGKELARKRGREQYKKRIDKVKAYQKEYNEKNRGYVHKRQQKRTKERYNSDPMFKLGYILRRNFKSALRKHLNATKSDRTFKLLGCSLDYFVEYFESLFEPGMTWAAFLRGEIHVDHIQPCASFNLQDPAQQRICFHYTNLQPLWAKDNMQKGAKLNWKKEAG
jgi:hypothetical protein